MSDFWEMVIPAVTVSFIFLVIFGFIAFTRYLQYKETIALAERGLLKESRAKNGRNTLHWGIVITSMGVALSCGMLPVGFLINGNNVPFFGPWMLVGLLPLFFGLALITIHTITAKEAAKTSTSEAGDHDPIPPHKN